MTRLTSTLRSQKLLVLRYRRGEGAHKGTGMFPGVKSTLTLGHKAPRKAQQLELRWYEWKRVRAGCRRVWRFYQPPRRASQRTRMA